MPVRHRRSRAKGSRLPAGVICVTRGTKWGNPYRVGDTVHIGPAYSGRDHIVADAADAVRLYRKWLFNLRSSAELVAPLRGRDLACWCPLDAPCHADVLLELANQ